MRPYAFEVLRGENVLHLETPALTDCAAEMWRKVAELSRQFQIPGNRIVVRDDRGHMLVSIGVVAALKLAQQAA